MVALLGACITKAAAFQSELDALTHEETVGCWEATLPAGRGQFKRISEFFR